MPLAQAATTAQTGDDEKQNQFAGSAACRQNEAAQKVAGEVTPYRADDIVQAGLFGEIDFK
jgi:hypothetical protein